MRKKRITALLPVICLGALLCGFSFLNTVVAIDTEKNKVYKYAAVDSIEQEFAADKEAAAARYKDNYFLLSGKAKSISPKGDSITLSGGDGKGEIVCKCSDKNVRADILKYSVGDSAAVYGRLKVGAFDKEQYIQIEKTVKAPSLVKSSETYYLLNGDSFDGSKTLTRTLGNGRVSYSIPGEWKDIEINITEQELGMLEGYQYVLNKMPGRESPEPECVFVTYFDKKLLKNASDIKKQENVEKVIVENIEGSSDNLPSKKVKTYYGSEYQYYLGKYTGAFDAGRGYRTEYIFQEDGENGLAMVLYVYRDSNYLSDVVFLTRFLRVAGTD